MPKYNKVSTTKTKLEGLSVRRYHIPLGTYILASSKRDAVTITTEEKASANLDRWERDNILTQEVNEHNDCLVKQLDAYFTGKLRQFSVPQDLQERRSNARYGSFYLISLWRNPLIPSISPDFGLS